MHQELDSVFELNDNGDLQTLCTGAFDAVVLSLVLSFLPTPELRREAGQLPVASSTCIAAFYRIKNVEVI